MIVIGVDEAGYGPPLGPLVLGATVWNTPEWSSGELWDQLDQICRRVNSAGVRIADSKQVYQSGRGWESLERGVWAALASLGQRCPSTYAQLFRSLDPHWPQARAAAPWENGFRCQVPLRCSRQSILHAAQVFAQATQPLNLLAVQARVVFPAQFNRLLERHGNKAQVLTWLTLQLVKQCWPSTNEPTVVICDKHGGRKHYQQALNECFPRRWLLVRECTPQCSAYWWQGSNHQVQWFFFRQGERHLVVALASMVAKYLRQLAMESWNRFWQTHLPHLRPTAGYAQDAQRFWNQIASVRKALGWPQHWLWRNR